MQYGIYGHFSVVFKTFSLLWSQWNRCRRSIELYYSAPSGCVSSPRSWRWHVWQAQQSEKNDLKMLSVLLSVLLLGPITIIRLTDEFPSICGQLGLTATDPSKSQKERTRMLGLVVSCVVVLYSSRLVRGWNEMSKGQISWFLLCFFSFSLAVLIVIGIYLVPDKGLLVIHYFVSLLSLWLTHIFLWFMDRGKFATDIYWIFLYPSSLYRQAEKKVASRQARKRRILVNYSPKKKREKERFHVCTKAVCHDFCKVSSWRVFCSNWNKQSFCLALINDNKPSIDGTTCLP